MDLAASVEMKTRGGQILYKNDRLEASETVAATSDVVVTSSSNFSQAAIDSEALSTLGSREVLRGSAGAALDDVVDEMSRRVYVQAVAADF